MDSWASPVIGIDVVLQKTASGPQPLPDISVENLGAAAIATTNTTCQIASTAVTAQVGSTIVVQLGLSSSGVASVTDSAGNTYTAQATQISSPSTRRHQVFTAAVTTELASGSTITATTTLNNIIQIGAVVVHGLATSYWDTQVVAAGTSTAPQSAAITPAQAATLYIAGISVSSGSPDTYTHPDGWTTLVAATAGGTETVLRRAYKIVNSIATETYGPATNSASRTWLASTHSLKGA